jgi:hypothetical protein
MKKLLPLILAVLVLLLGVPAFAYTNDAWEDFARRNNLSNGQYPPYQTKSGYDITLVCMPTPIPQTQPDRDPVTRIEISWTWNHDLGGYFLAVTHIHNSGKRSHRIAQYDNLEFAVKSGEHTWLFQWAGRNVEAHKMYIVGVIEKAAEASKTYWSYTEYASKFSDPQYKEVIAKASCDGSPQATNPQVVENQPSQPNVAAQELTFSQLPKEARNLVDEVRNRCKEAEPDMKLDYEMSGIQVYDLNGDGSRDIFIDDGELCGGLRIAGGNCSNRGCDMTIFKEISRGQWRQIFQEHLHAKFIAIDWETMRFQLMVASIYAGDPRCQPHKEYTSGHSCNLIVTFRNNRWNWQKIP